MDSPPVPPPPSRGPWREYAIAAVIYCVLAVWLFSINRPGLFGLSVIFAIASVAGAAYLYRRPPS